MRFEYKKINLILYNSACVIDKVRQRLLSSCTTAPPITAWLFLEKTPTKVKPIQESIFDQLASALIATKFRLT